MGKPTIVWGGPTGGGGGGELGCYLAEGPGASITGDNNAPILLFPDLLDDDADSISGPDTGGQYVVLEGPGPYEVFIGGTVTPGTAAGADLVLGLFEDDGTTLVDSWTETLPASGAFGFSFDVDFSGVTTPTGLLMVNLFHPTDTLTVDPGVFIEVCEALDCCGASGELGETMFSGSGGILWGGTVDEGCDQILLYDPGSGLPLTPQFAVGLSGDVSFSMQVAPDANVATGAAWVHIVGVATNTLYGESIITSGLSIGQIITDSFDIMGVFDPGGSLPESARLVITTAGTTSPGLRFVNTSWTFSICEDPPGGGGGGLDGKWALGVVWIAS